MDWLYLSIQTITQGTFLLPWSSYPLHMDKLIQYCQVVEFTLSDEDVKKEAASLTETHFIYQDSIWRIYDYDD